MKRFALSVDLPPISGWSLLVYRMFSLLLAAVGAGGRSFAVAAPNPAKRRGTRGGGRWLGVDYWLSLPVELLAALLASTGENGLTRGGGTAATWLFASCCCPPVVFGAAGIEKTRGGGATEELEADLF